MAAEPPTRTANNGPDPLAGLQDLAVPAPPPWLPPEGPGWVLLGLLVLAALLWLGWRIRRWRRRTRYRREALAQLARLAPALATAQGLSALSALLKRTALAAYPREAVASLAGTTWRDFLCASGAPAFADAACDPLFDSAYRAHRTTDAHQRAAVLAAARQWIRAHRTPRHDGRR